MDKPLQFRHRDYHASQGRFLQEDPLGYVDGSNLHQAYVSSPVNFVDPSGLKLGWDPERTDGIQPEETPSGMTGSTEEDSTTQPSTQPSDPTTEPSTEPSEEEPADPEGPSPSGRDLIQDKNVRDALDKAWEKSDSEKDKSQRREVSSSILVNELGKYYAWLFDLGVRGERMSEPGFARGKIGKSWVVANLHTHPFGNPEPSPSDLEVVKAKGVPTIIRHHTGYTIVETDGSIHHADEDGNLID